MTLRDPSLAILLALPMVMLVASLLGRSPGASLNLQAGTGATLVGALPALLGTMRLTTSEWGGAWIIHMLPVARTKVIAARATFWILTGWCFAGAQLALDRGHEDSPQWPRVAVSLAGIAALALTQAALFGGVVARLHGSRPRLPGVWLVLPTLSFLMLLWLTQQPLVLQLHGLVLLAIVATFLWLDLRVAGSLPSDTEVSAGSPFLRALAVVLTFGFGTGASTVWDGGAGPSGPMVIIAAGIVAALVAEALAGPPSAVRNFAPRRSSVGTVVHSIAALIGGIGLALTALALEARFGLRSEAAKNVTPALWKLGIPLMMVAAVVEEYVFRRLVQHQLLQVGNRALSVLLTALSFGALHPTGNVVLPTVLGILSGTMYARWERLSPCILLHTGYNLAIILSLSRLAGLGG